MNALPAASRAALVGLLTTGSALTSLIGQPVESAPPSSDEEVVVLSPFHTYGRQEGRYQPTDTTSGGRVRVSLFDAP